MKDGAGDTSDISANLLKKKVEQNTSMDWSTINI